MLSELNQFYGTQYLADTIEVKVPRSSFDPKEEQGMFSEAKPSSLLIEAASAVVVSYDMHTRSYLHMRDATLRVSPAHAAVKGITAFLARFPRIIELWAFLMTTICFGAIADYSEICLLRKGH